MSLYLDAYADCSDEGGDGEEGEISDDSHDFIDDAEIVQSPSTYRAQNNEQEADVLDDIIEVQHVATHKGRKVYHLRNMNDIESEFDREIFYKVFNSDTIYEIDDMSMILILTVFLSFDSFNIRNINNLIKEKDYARIVDFLDKYDIDDDVRRLLQHLCNNEVDVDFNELVDCIAYLRNLSDKLQINIYRFSKKSHKRRSPMNAYNKIDTYSIFDLLYKSTHINLPINDRLIPMSVVLVKIDNNLKGFYISDLKYLFYHLSSKNNPIHTSVCPICEFRLTSRLSKSAKTAHMMNCNGKGRSIYTFDTDGCLHHHPSSLSTIKPPFIISGNMETIRENKTMSVISYALNVMFLDIDTGIVDKNLKTMRYSFTVVCDFVSYSDIFDSLPVELMMFYRDDLKDIRDDIVLKYENKEISLGGLCLIDIFIIDIMCREFLKRIYYANRDLNVCLRNSDKIYEQYKEEYEMSNSKCYQCNMSIDYVYDKTSNVFTINSFKEIFKKYVLTNYGDTLSKYRSIVRQYDVMFQTYLDIVQSYYCKSLLGFSTEDVDDFTSRLSDFNGLYGLTISYAMLIDHTGYLHNNYVLHHHPFSNKMLGPSHRICNLSQTITLNRLRTDVYFHNIGFDSLFFLNQIIPEILEFFGDRELSMIFNGSKLKYMFSENFSFKDSYSIFQCSASSLFDTFTNENREDIVKQCFMNLYNTFSDDMKNNYTFNELFDDFKVMCQGKGIALYDDVCRKVLKSKTQFPSKYIFRSSLKEFSDVGIDSLYEIFKNLYNKYGFDEKDFGLLDFNDFYNMLDAELLSHAIRTITTAEEDGKVYTVRHTSIPTSARALIVYSSNVILRYLPNMNIYEIFRSTKIGGYSGVHVPITYNTESFKKDIQFMP